MANVVDDFKRATKEINEIQEVLENKGKITPGSTVPFEDYSDLINSMGDTITVTGSFDVQNKFVVTSDN